jgi:uncharacterized repeat protein (TIGR01451 family)
MRKKLSLACRLLLLVSALVLSPQAARAGETFSLATNLVDISRSHGNETDPSIAFNPVNPSNMLVAAATDKIVPGLFLAFSTNLGVSWQTNFIATNNDAQGLIPAYGEPSVAWDSFGNLFLAYLPANYEGVAVAMSTNGGRTFTLVTNLAPLDATDQPRITAPFAGTAAGSVWVIYKDYTSAGTPLQVQGALATGLGTNGTFGVAQIVPNSTSGGFADISVGPLGQVAVAFQDNLQGLPNPFNYPQANIWVCIETNAVYGGTVSSNGFGEAQIVAADAIGGVTYIQAANSGTGVNAASGLAWDFDSFETNYDKVYLIYTAIGPNGNAVINFLSSDGSGTNWNGGTFVDDDATNNSNDHFFPRVAVDPVSGVISCSWYDCRNDQGASSQGVTNEYTESFILAGYMVTNIDFTDNSGDISQTWIDTTGQGTNIMVTISANNIYGTEFKVDRSDNIYIYGPSITNFIINAAGTNTNVNATVTITFTDIFTKGYTSGSGANQEAIMYTTLSFDGGGTFLANEPLSPPNQQINAPAVGIASDVAGSDSLTGWGHYSGLTAYGANFFPVWADNSDITTNNPDGANGNFDLYMLRSSGGQSPFSVPNADLSVWITNTPNPVISDGVLVYSLVVSNNGPAKADTVKAIDLLSPYVTLEQVTPALGGFYSLTTATNGQQEILFTFPSLAAHEALTNVIRVTASTSSVDTNIAVVSSPLIDLDPTNNFYQLALVIDGQDLAVGMTASETNVLSGDTVVSSVTVTNLGPATNGPVFITNQFSSDWTNVSVVAQGTNLVTNTPAGPLVIVNLGLLPVGQPVTATFTSVALGLGPFASEFAMVASQDVDTNLANNVAAIGYAVQGEDLAISLSAGPASVQVGQTVNFTEEVSNLGLSTNGEVVVTNVFSENMSSITVLLPATNYSISQNMVVLDLGTLSAGQVVPIIITAIPTSTDAGFDNATVSSQNFDTNLANNSANTTFPVNGEDLAISLSASPTSVPVGQTVTFTEEVSNLGLPTYVPVMVSNLFSGNLSALTVLQPATNYTISQNTIIFDLGTLAAGQFVPITITAVPASTGAGFDTAMVASQNFDTNPASQTTAAITITPALPMISNLVVVPLASSAFIIWDTAFAATVQVQYGITSNYGSFSGVTARPSTHHSVLLTGLTSGTNYAFEALSWIGSQLYTTNGSFSLTNTLILNTEDAQYSGLWTKGSVAPGIYGTYYQYATTTVFNATASAVYAPYISAAGLYDVSIWYPQNALFTTKAQVYIHGGTNDIVRSVNETANGGAWQLLASSMYFAGGTNGHVIMYNDTGETNKYLVANAMKWSYIAAQDDPTNGGVPAWWANYYFGTTNGAVSGSADSDGDGYSNFAEYVLGTDPTDAASYLNFSMTLATNDILMVTFSPWQGGRSYQLQAAPNLPNSAWTTLTNNYTVGTNGVGSFMVNQKGATGFFYRLSTQISP